MRVCRNVSVIGANARIMVSTLSQAKLPVTTSQPWVRITSSPAMLPTVPGTNRRNGTTSCTMWLPSTSSRWIGFGSRCAMRLTGFGIGWVSWWKYMAVRSRHAVSPRSLIMPAPNSSRNTSHVVSTNMVSGGGTASDPRKAAWKPASTSSISQPKP